MKILNAHQVREADQYTILHEPISSVDLMERAGLEIFSRLIKRYSEYNVFSVFCGPGNNGGDGLVIARLLHNAGKEVEAWILKGTFTDEFSLQFKKLKQQGIPFIQIESEMQMEDVSVPEEAVVIDALFGMGINRPLEGLAGALVQRINAFHAHIVAVDLPSGMSADGLFESTISNTVIAHYTYSIHLPKMAFMFAENNRFTGSFECVDIGLSETFLASLPTPHLYTGEWMIAKMIKPRNVFGHKGTFGHALIVAGSAGKTGAAILASSAALRTGCGLLTASVPEGAATSMHAAFPEAMVVTRSENKVKLDHSAYKAVGFGPGMGATEATADLLFELLNLYHEPLVIDADGLNCLANNPTWYGYLKANIILTPHPGEFDRLTRVHASAHERYQAQQHFSRKHQVTVVLKGHHTSVTTPSGLTFFNSTGNSGMATAGSGDVLTGIITSLCAQGYPPEDAAVLGVYMHGYAGDSAALEFSGTSLIASDIIKHIPFFFKRFEK